MMGDVLEEADECGYWIEILVESGKIERDHAVTLLTKFGRRKLTKPQSSTRAGRILHSTLAILHSILPARAISTKNKHLLVIYSIPTRGFTAAVSVFRGTPPPKPLECKFRLNTMGALLCD